VESSSGFAARLARIASPTLFGSDVENLAVNVTYETATRVRIRVSVSLSCAPCGLGGGVNCRISPPRFLAECCKRQLNQGSFVSLYFSLFTFSDLY